MEPIFPTFDYDEILHSRARLRPSTCRCSLAAETDAHYATKDKLEAMTKERDTARAELAKVSGVLGRSRAAGRMVRAERDTLRRELDELRARTCDALGSIPLFTIADD